MHNIWALCVRRPNPAEASSRSPNRSGHSSTARLLVTRMLLFVPFVDDIVQVFRGWQVEGLEAKVIEDQQIEAEIGLQAPFAAAIGPSAVDVAQNAVGVHKEGRVTLATGFMGQRLGQMGLAHAGGAAEEDVAFAADIGAGRQVEDLV